MVEINEKASGDSAVIRSELRVGDVRFRGAEQKRADRKRIKKALRTLHTLETMAVNIYQYQITHEDTAHNRYLIAAMCNEMTHLQDFQVMLYEYGLRPGVLRWGYWLFGIWLGIVSRMLGRKAVLKTGMWVEAKAVDHYEKLLNDVEWDAEGREVIAKNQADENSHISRWRSLLEGQDKGC